MPKRNIKNDLPAVTSIRLPEDTREMIRILLNRLNFMTGIPITRSEFILIAIQYYLQYLLDAESDEEIIEKIKKFQKN